jgi:hypothetical protein
MRRHVVIAIETGENGERWEDAGRLIEDIRASLAAMPVNVIEPSHGRTQMNPRVEFVGWTREDEQRGEAA